LDRDFCILDAILLSWIGNWSIFDENFVYAWMGKLLTWIRKLVSLDEKWLYTWTKLIASLD
jgi:hypothetical protein